MSRRPEDLGLLMTLGNTYPINREDGTNERLRWFQAAVAAAPTNPAAHNNLGITLSDKGQVEEAIACYNKAIKLDPNYSAPHSNLGIVLAGKGQVDKAIASYKKAIELDPKSVAAHSNLGLALYDKGQADKAIAAHKKAIELGPKSAKAHNNLGQALAGEGQVEEAIASYKKAIELNPKFAVPHNNLGLALYGKGQVDKAIACYNKCIELAPRHPGSRCNLGAALARQGRFAESLAAYKRGHELGTKLPRWGNSSAEWVRLAEARVALEAKLPAFLKGEFQPGDNKERLTLAVVCQAKKLHHAATGLYTAALAADPRLADDLEWEHRHNAACCAALGAAGQGEDAAKLDDKERMRLRKQALDWLRADLALRTRQLESNKPADHAAVLQALRYWQTEADLAGIRDKAALAKLPAQEQKAFAQLWADVAATLKKAEK